MDRTGLVSKPVYLSKQDVQPPYLSSHMTKISIFLCLHDPVSKNPPTITNVPNSIKRILDGVLWNRETRVGSAVQPVSKQDIAKGQ